MNIQCDFKDMAEEQRRERAQHQNSQDERVPIPCLFLYRNTSHLIGHYGYMPRVYPVFRTLRLSLGHPLVDQIADIVPYMEDPDDHEINLGSREHNSTSRQPCTEVGSQGCCSSPSPGIQEGHRFPYEYDAQENREGPSVCYASHVPRTQERPQVHCPLHSLGIHEEPHVCCASSFRTQEVPRFTVNQERTPTCCAPHLPGVNAGIQTQRGVRRQAGRAVIRGTRSSGVATQRGAQRPAGIATRMGSQRPIRIVTQRGAQTSIGQETQSEEQRSMGHTTQWGEQRATEFAAQRDARLEESAAQRDARLEESAAQRDAQLEESEAQRDARIHRVRRLEGFISQRGAQRPSVRAAQRQRGRAVLRGVQRPSLHAEQRSPERAAREAQRPSVCAAQRPPGRAALRGVQRTSVRVAQRPPGRAALRGVQRPFLCAEQRSPERVAREAQRPSVRAARRPPGSSVLRGAQRPSVRAAQRPPGRVALRGAQRLARPRGQRGALRPARIHRIPHELLDHESLEDLAPQLLGGNPRQNSTCQLSQNQVMDFFIQAGNKFFSFLHHKAKTLQFS